MDAAQIFRALEYVSRDLRRKRLHVHLIVGGSSLPCLVHKTKPTCTGLNLIFVTPPSPKTLTTLTRSVGRAQKLFNLSQTWVNTTLEASIPAELRDDVIYRTLLQNDIVFSSEGLTLLALDHCFALKSTLDRLNRGSWDASFDTAVDILRRLVYISRGRPMTRGYIQQCYRSIEIPDNTLLRLNAEYEAMYNHRGVVGVNDEYIGWRRDGLTWSAELEEYGSELAFSLSRSSSPASQRSDWEDKPLPDPPRGDRDTIREIFAGPAGGGGSI
ncbi:hypothetical protein K440DRAFT_559898 [Wilcoxina mikolae CBS 423.85]|nr:hypothetical protein K440DRAFT_559898 [Wilcoxina mikolae CBS 423.85]